MESDWMVKHWLIQNWPAAPAVAPDGSSDCDPGSPGPEIGNFY